MSSTPFFFFPDGLHQLVLDIGSLATIVARIGFLCTFTALGFLVLHILKQKGLPGVAELKGYPLIGAAYYYYRDGMPALLGKLIEVGDDGMSFARVGPHTLVSVHDPELVKEVLSLPDEVASREGSLGRMTWSPFGTIRRMIGNSLFNRVGPETSYHRNAFIREFNNTKSNEKKYGTIATVAKVHAEALFPSSTDESVHIEDIRFSADNFAVSLWGQTLYNNPEQHSDGKVLQLSERMAQMAADPWSPVWHFLALLMRLVGPGEPTGAEVKVRLELDAVMAKNMNRLEEYERKNPEGPLRIMRSLSVATGGGRNGPLSPCALEFTNLNVFGGHHSIGLNVTWALIELQKRPECLAKLMAEIDSSDLNDFVTVNSKMPYLDAVIMEINRLHPTVHATLRVMNREKQLVNNGAVLRPGMLIYVSYLHLHTSPKYWGPTAGKFCPERFFGGHDKEKPFMAFGYGSRNCVGYKFAILAAKVYLAMLLKMYRVKVLASQHEAKIGAILETGTAVACTVTRRY